MKLTYKFNNDENKLDIQKLEYLNPGSVEFYFREGDSIYVKEGDNVCVNQLLIESSSGIKTYSSVAGVVSVRENTLVITNDYTELTLISEEAIRDINELKKDEIISICEKIGISFENRLIANKLKANSKILVINAMDVEPYQFNSNYLLQDNIKNMLDVIDLLSKRFNLNSYLFLNKYYYNNVAVVNEKIDYYKDIHFKVINDVFPFTTNGVIAKKYFKEYKLEEILFLDALSLYKIFVALKERLPVSNKFITVMLNDPSKSYVINTKYGSNLKKAIVDSFKPDFENKDIYLNNFMRKAKCDNFDSLVVDDNIKSVYIFDKMENNPSKCIKCGKCVDICPVGINPTAKKLDAACIRCGLCNYVCPANINLISREK